MEFKITEKEVEALREGKTVHISDWRFGRSGYNGKVSLSLESGSEPHRLEIHE